MLFVQVNGLHSLKHKQIQPTTHKYVSHPIKVPVPVVASICCQAKTDIQVKETLKKEERGTVENDIRTKIKDSQKEINLPTAISNDFKQLQ